MDPGKCQEICSKVSRLISRLAGRVAGLVDRCPNSDLGLAAATIFHPRSAIYRLAGAFGKKAGQPGRQGV